MMAGERIKFFPCTARKAKPRKPTDARAYRAVAHGKAASGLGQLIHLAGPGLERKTAFLPRIWGLGSVGVGPGCSLGSGVWRERLILKLFRSYKLKLEMELEVLASSLQRQDRWLSRGRKVT